LVALPLVESHLESEELFTEPLLLALPTGHPLADRKRVTVRDLASERFILLSEMHCLAEQTLNFCRAHECQPFIACKSAQITTIQKLIAWARHFLTRLARRADDSGPSSRPLSGDQPRTIGVVWHKHYFHSPSRGFWPVRQWAKQWFGG
jgi:LysR family hydrogen peroxide-inducible transcriptional activator